MSGKQREMNEYDPKKEVDFVTPSSFCVRVTTIWLQQALCKANEYDYGDDERQGHDEGDDGYLTTAWWMVVDDHITMMKGQTWGEEKGRRGCKRVTNGGYLSDKMQPISG